MNEFVTNSFTIRLNNKVCCKLNKQSFRISIIILISFPPKKLRRIKYYDCESDKGLIFLTNNMELKPDEIAYLYKKRWEVELFFKWMKQHLKIKSFWRTNNNAVKIQMYLPVCDHRILSCCHNW